MSKLREYFYSRSQLLQSLWRTHCDGPNLQSKPPPNASNNNATCPACGAEVSPRARFCKYCGSAVTQQFRAEAPSEPTAFTSELTKKSDQKHIYAIYGAVALIMLVIVVALLYSAAETNNNATIESGDYYEDSYTDTDSSGQDYQDSTSQEDSYDNNSYIQDDSYNNDDYEDNTSSPDEEHTYSFYQSDCTWWDAYDESQLEGGYLVHIDSYEELNYILSLIEDQGMEKMIFWIGGHENDGDYYWIDEDQRTVGNPLNSSNSWCYDLWASGEPNFHYDGVDEDCMVLFHYSTEDRWVFMDVPNNVLSEASYYEGKIGYIVEYE